MKHLVKLLILFLTALLLLLILSACRTPSDEKSDNLASNGNDSASTVIATYVYEKEGSGGGFTITLQKENHFSYYTGFLSSYIGYGDYTIEDEILTLATSDGMFVHRFRYEDDAIFYIADGSSQFMYVSVADGDRFDLTPDVGSVIFVQAKEETP